MFYCTKCDHVCMHITVGYKLTRPDRRRKEWNELKEGKKMSQEAFHLILLLRTFLAWQKYELSVMFSFREQKWNPCQKLSSLSARKQKKKEWKWSLLHFMVVYFNKREWPLYAFYLLDGMLKYYSFYVSLITELER